ncbi:MAG: hypothetical protein BWY83_00721 [bacterium ADurb.Bin478]|nr:MAG: hypothetical protein BWY83_00721 [bacterium ADurb.Bin478]
MHRRQLLGQQTGVKRAGGLIDQVLPFGFEVLLGCPFARRSHLHAGHSGSAEKKRLRQGGSVDKRVLHAKGELHIIGHARQLGNHVRQRAQHGFEKIGDGLLLDIPGMLQIGVTADLRQNVRSGLPDARPGFGHLFFRHFNFRIFFQGLADAFLDRQHQFILSSQTSRTGEEDYAQQTIGFFQSHPYLQKFCRAAAKKQPLAKIRTALGRGKSTSFGKEKGIK